MNRFYFNEHEVKLGDVINVTTNKVLPNGNKVVEYSNWILDSEDTLNSLVEAGVLTKEGESISIPTNVDYYIKAFGETLGKYNKNAIDFFNNLFVAYSIEALCILWREIMWEYLLKHHDNIDDYDTVYGISKKDGSILTIDNNKHYADSNRFVVFRTKEEAKLAIEITKDYYDEVFGK